MKKKRYVAVGLTALGAVALIPGAAGAEAENPTKDKVVAGDSLLGGACTARLRWPGLRCGK